MRVQPLPNWDAFHHLQIMAVAGPKQRPSNDWGTEIDPYPCNPICV